MLKNYLTIALRNLWQNKTYATINICGLGMGMAACLLILVFVQDELSYDRHYPHADRIYRIADHFAVNGKEIHTAMTPAAWGPQLQVEFPEIEAYSRIFNTAEPLIHIDEQRFTGDQLYYADSTFFKVFSFPLLQGNPATALVAPNAIVISESAARKYFGREDALGKTLRMDEDTVEYQITGVMADVPHNSHLQPDLIASFVTLKAPFLSSWTLHYSLYTYLLLKEGSSPKALEAKLPDFFRRHLEPEVAARYQPELQPVQKIHLYSDLLAEISPNGAITYVYLFSAIAVVILLLACINYVNLSTARSLQRAKEVGVRKVLGARLRDLMGQFLLESILLTIGALLLALALVQLALPVLNELSGKSLSYAQLFQQSTLLTVAGIALLVGVGVGAYPGIFLARFKPVQVLKDRLTTRVGGAGMRKMLVVFQFAVSVVLMIGTFTIARQFHYLVHKKLGFQKEQVVVIPLGSEAVRQHREALQDALLRLPGVEQVAASSAMPGQFFSQHMFQPEGVTEEERLLLPVLEVDENFLETLGIALAEGRGFSHDHTTDSSAFILNEAAVKKLGWTVPIGKDMEWWYPTGKNEYTLAKKGKVIGVVKDFHFTSLHQTIEPLVMLVNPASFTTLSVRIKPEHIPETLAALQQTWQQYDTENPFAYSFLDEDWAALYQTEERTGKIFGYFAALGICIACLGLFGLATFTAGQRVKEIGIRKVLGASAFQITALLSRDFLQLVLIALAVAIPLAWYAMDKWLEDFAYRVHTGWWIFAAAGMLALLIACLTVCYQSIKAALANPVDSLRNE